ncbi:52 kDa repressor of the inhibitor of the protein kinase-like [Protopterus annectens]|uniref:52 kDa repressor of the inhibitor of the protein kinase-like n=1 Tax=Protopterus annectens TaxID=7888 RepID=UPI001CF99A4C|nr:52 kDa repressor of the inhibitor of the protein kinase-like [Protopterus annectens]
MDTTSSGASMDPITGSPLLNQSDDPVTPVMQSDTESSPSTARGIGTSVDQSTGVSIADPKSGAGTALDMRAPRVQQFSSSKSVSVDLSRVTNAGTGASLVDKPMPSTSCAQSDRPPLVEDICVYNRSHLTDAQRKEILSCQWRPPAGFRFPTRLMGPEGASQRSRRFNARLLDEYPFARYSKKLDGVFCGPCFVFTSNTDCILVSSPMRDWSNGKKILERHSRSKNHGNASVRADAFLSECSGKQTVSQVFVTQKTKTSYKSLYILRCVIDILEYCARSNIPLRGKTNDDGHVKGLLNLCLKHDAELRDCFQSVARNAMYTSPQIQNELLGLMALQIQRHILRNVRAARWFCLLADGIDTSTKEQIALAVRYVHQDDVTGAVEIREDFVEFVEAIVCTGRGLGELFLRRLVAWGVDAQCMRGQGYNRSANMSDKFSGAQAHIQTTVPDAVYTACKAHGLNTAVLQSCSLQAVRNMFDFTKKIAVKLKHFTKRTSLFAVEVKGLGALASDFDEEPTHMTTFPAADIQWRNQTDSLARFIDQYALIARSLEKIGQFDSDCCALLCAIKEFTFIVALVCVEHVLARTKPLHLYLQRVDIDLMQAVEEACNIVQILRDMREQSETVFAELYPKILAMAGSVLTVECICSLQNQKDVSTATQQDYYRLNVLVPFLDHVVSELQDQLINCRERFIGQYVIPTKLPLLKEEHELALFSAFKNDLSSLDELKIELLRWRTKWGTAPLQSQPNSIVATLQNVNKHLYPCVHAILSVLATMPVSISSVERSFSALRRMKYWLRIGMGDQRLCALAVLHIHQDIPLSVDQVLRDFDPCKDRRFSDVHMD